MDAGVLLLWRIHGGGRLLRRRDLRRKTAGDSRWTFAVALHAVVRRDSGDPADYHPAVLAGVAEVERKEGCRHAEASQHRGVVPAGVAAHDHRDVPDVRVRLRRGVWRAPAFAAYCSGPAGSQQLETAAAATDRC